MARWLPGFPQRGLRNRKVDFAVCGTQKGGTRALVAYLKEHPAIGMSRRKETHFFDDEDVFREGEPDYCSYHARFRPERSHRVFGEVTPIYMYWRSAPQRMARYNPAMKLIVILRNPITRAYSHWNMEYAKGKDTLSFWEALQTEPQRCAEAAPLQHRVYSYVDRGRYLCQLQRMWAAFPREQVLILRTEDLRTDPQATVGRVCDFLGVPRMPVETPKSVHDGVYAAPMGQRERRFLQAAFEQEIADLERALNWNCQTWLAD
jgi:hypothetical protein